MVEGMPVGLQLAELPKLLFEGSQKDMTALDTV